MRRYSREQKRKAGKREEPERNLNTVYTQYLVNSKTIPFWMKLFCRTGRNPDRHRKFSFVFLRIF
jgi:hypothetical protein